MPHIPHDPNININGWTNRLAVNGGIVVGTTGGWGITADPVGTGSPQTVTGCIVPVRTRYSDAAQCNNH